MLIYLCLGAKETHAWYRGTNRAIKNVTRSKSIYKTTVLYQMNNNILNLVVFTSLFFWIEQSKTYAIMRFLYIYRYNIPFLYICTKIYGNYYNLYGPGYGFLKLTFVHT